MSNKLVVDTDKHNKCIECNDSEITEIYLPKKNKEIIKKKIKIDKCIFLLVKALNEHGISTRASCCGHGYQPGSIVLADDRELLICKDMIQARKMLLSFPDINGRYLEKREYKIFNGKEYCYFIG